MLEVGVLVVCFGTKFDTFMADFCDRFHNADAGLGIVFY